MFRRAVRASFLMVRDDCRAASDDCRTRFCVFGINQEGTAFFDFAKNAFELRLNFVSIEGSDVVIGRGATILVLADFDGNGFQFFQDQLDSACRQPVAVKRIASVNGTRILDFTSRLLQRSRQVKQYALLYRG